MVSGRWSVVSEAEERELEVREKRRTKPNLKRSLITWHQEVNVDRFGVIYAERSHFREACR
jgi:hypothetical protein